MKAGWQTKKLGELLEIQNGYAFSSRDYSETGHFLMRIGNVQNGYVSLSDPKYVGIPPDSPLQRFALSEGDILVSLTGNVGRVGVVQGEHLPSVLNQRVARIAINETSPATREFLLFFLYSDWFREELGFAGHGAAQQNVSTKDILEIQLPIPSLSEQQRIVGILDEAFDGIATAKANAEQNLQNARALFESHLQSVFTQRGEGWVGKPLSELCDIKHGFAFDGAEFSSDVPEGKPIVITPGNFTEDGKLLFNEKNTKRFSGKPPAAFRFDIGDLVVVMTDLSSRMKILGKPAFVETDDVLHNQRIGRVVFFDDSVEKRFVYYFMMSEGFLKNIKMSATGTMVKHTAPSRILSNVISFPAERKEQMRVVAKLDALREETQRLESLYQRKLAALDELKKSLLHQAFSGAL